MCQHYKNYAVFLLLVAFLLPTNLFSQDSKILESGKFDRKSVTIIPVTFGEYSKYEKPFIDGLLNVEKTSRYDYNYITWGDLRTFQDGFNKSKYDAKEPKSEESINEISNLIKKTVLKRILESTGNIDSLNARIARSERRVAVSAASAEKISSFDLGRALLLYNGTYLSVNVLLNAKMNEKEGKAECMAYWFKINVDKVNKWEGTVPSVEETELILVKAAKVKSSVESR